MKTQRFDFNFRPLQLQISFAVDGSVPDRQNYNADAAEYTPDYTLTPLIIQPRISILDKDGVIAAGEINAKLANVKWYEITGSTKTQISTSSTDYEMTTSGGQTGRIKVKKNAQPLQPITLQFYAEYTDTRNSQIMVIQGSYLIACDSASETVRVELNAAPQTVFNPLADPDTQTVTAKVFAGAGECAASKYALVWEVMGEDNTWHEAGSDTVLDYHVAVSGNTATVNRRLMGGELHLRCRAKYDRGGNPSSVTLDDSSPCAVCVFERRIPQYEYDIAEVPYNVPAGILEIKPRAIVRTNEGQLTDTVIERELLPLWYMATNKASGSLSYSLVGKDVNPVLKTSLMSNEYGAVVGLDIKDPGFEGSWEDSDGALFEDADGNLITIH